MAEKRKIKLSIISIWIGILIPISAAFIPYLVEYVILQYDLKYQLIGPITANSQEAIELRITDDGNVVEKNVTVWLKHDLYYEEDKQKKLENIVIVDTDVSHNLFSESEHFAISLGDIRPEESVRLSILSEFIRVSLYDYILPSGISIKSDEHIAQLDKPSDFEEFFHPLGFWMFLILMILLFFIGIYQEYLMSPKQREKMILKEIDKLDK